MHDRNYFLLAIRNSNSVQRSNSVSSWEIKDSEIANVTKKLFIFFTVLSSQFYVFVMVRNMAGDDIVDCDAGLTTCASDSNFRTHKHMCLALIWFVCELRTNLIAMWVVD